jgi:hypothetical protein
MMVIGRDGKSDWAEAGTIAAANKMPMHAIHTLIIPSLLFVAGLLPGRTRRLTRRCWFSE